MFKPVFIINENVKFEDLSCNPSAIHILEQNMDKVDWEQLSKNPNAIHILEKHLDKVYWWNLSENPNAIHILEQNLDKVHWYYLCTNPNTIHLLFKLDTGAMRENCKLFAEKLAAYVFHPLRLEHMANTYGFELDEYMDYIM